MRKWVALLLCCFGCAPQSTPQVHAERWAAYYDKDLPAATFKDCNLVVFDRLYYPKFKSIKGKTVVLAYISMGEVHGDRPAKEVMSKANALLGKQEHWGSYVVDMSAPEWKKEIFAQIDDALEKKFDGVMLDTVDSAIYYARQESEAKGKKAERVAVALIRDIHKRYPQAKIMLNRGFEILPQVARHIDYALAESILAQTDVSTGQSRLFPPNSYHLMASKLEEARNNAPRLKIYTLDYWNQDDVQGIHRIYAMQRARGYSPYVSTLDLRSYTPEPVEPLHTEIVSEDSHA